MPQGCGHRKHSVLLLRDVPNGLLPNKLGEIVHQGHQSYLDIHRPLVHLGSDKKTELQGVCFEFHWKNRPQGAGPIEKS